MRIDHVEVPLVDWHIGWLAHRATAVVQPWAGIGELDEVLKILQRAVAPAPVEVHHKGRAVGRGKHHVVATDLHAARRVAGMLGELFGCRLQYLAQVAGLELDAHAVNLGTGLFEHGQAFIVVTNVQAHFGQDAIRRGFDFEQVLFAHDVVGRDVAFDVCRSVYFGFRVTALPATLSPVLFMLRGRCCFGCRHVWCCCVCGCHGVCLGHVFSLLLLCLPERGMPGGS